MKWLLWDFDGTLAERPGLWSGAMVEAAALHGFSIERELVKPYLRAGFPWHFSSTVRKPVDDDVWWSRLESVFQRAYSQGAALTDAESRLVASSVRSIFLDCRSWRVFDDVTSCLTRLSAKGWQHLILSNHVPELSKLVDDLGLSEYFQTVFTSGRTGAEKPNAVAFQGALGYIGHADQVWMIGDSWEADVCGAATVGVDCILVREVHERARHAARDLNEIDVILEVS